MPEQIRWSPARPARITQQTVAAIYRRVRDFVDATGRQPGTVLVSVNERGHVTAVEPVP